MNHLTLQAKYKLSHLRIKLREEASQSYWKVWWWQSPSHCYQPIRYSQMLLQKSHVYLCNLSQDLLLETHTSLPILPFIWVPWPNYVPYILRHCHQTFLTRTFHLALLVMVVNNFIHTWWKASTLEKPQTTDDFSILLSRAFLRTEIPFTPHATYPPLSTVYLWTYSSLGVKWHNPYRPCATSHTQCSWPCTALAYCFTIKSCS
jgi:hypothetical protein